MLLPKCLSMRPAYTYAFKPDPDCDDVAMDSKKLSDNGSDASAKILGSK